MERVFAKWPLLRHPRTYGYRVVSNLVRDHVRDINREREASLEREVARVFRRPLGTVTRQVAEARQRLAVLQLEDR